MKYQLSYDRILSADKPFVLEETGEVISDISFYLRFGTIFESEKPKEMNVEVNESYYCLSDLVQVGYQRENKEFSFELAEGYTDGYEVCDYFVGVGVGIVEPRISTKKEIDQIINKYGNQFMTDQSLENYSYGIHEIKDNSVQVSEKVQKKSTNYPPYIEHMESLLNEIKQRVGAIPRNGIMAVRFRSECLRLMNLIEAAENKKNWFISQENLVNNMSEIIEWYMYLINLYEQKFTFLGQEGMYEMNSGEIFTEISSQLEGRKFIIVDSKFDNLGLANHEINPIENEEENKQDTLFILSSYVIFNKEKNLLRYENSRMNQLCGSETEEIAYYVSPFSKLNSDEQNNEYCYSTFTKDFIPIETCGILLDVKENEQIIEL